MNSIAKHILKFKYCATETPCLRAIYLNSHQCTSQMDETQWLWYKKNWQTNRPTSPWTVYKTQLPMATSLLHRITGVASYGSLALMAVGVNLLPNKFPYYIEIIENFGIHSHVINSVKIVLVMPVMYHILNGMRHLAWDLGKGFSLPTVYFTGYSIFILTVLLSAFVALKL